jgi:hypothetical protein
MRTSAALSAERLRRWHPSPQELDRILAEMRPIVIEFARRARAEGLVRPD